MNRNYITPAAGPFDDQPIVRTGPATFARTTPTDPAAFPIGQLINLYEDRARRKARTEQAAHTACIELAQCVDAIQRRYKLALNDLTQLLLAGAPNNVRGDKE